MVQWLDDEVVEAVMAWLIEMSSFLLGLYMWYLVLSFHTVELALLKRQTRLRLVHAPYLLGRYAHLIMLLTIVSAIPMAIDNPLASHGCASLGTSRLIAVTGDAALSTSSCNLALRAMVLWKDSRAVAWFLRCFSALHLAYSLILGSVGVVEQWDPDHIFCTFDVAPRAKGAFLAYFVCTVVWNITVFLLTVFGVGSKKLPPGLPLRSALLVQGVAYASLTTLICIPMGVMVYLQLNEAMHVLLFPLGCTISVIASSQAVASLLALKEWEPLSESQQATVRALYHSGMLTTGPHLLVSELHEMEVTAFPAGDDFAPALGGRLELKDNLHDDGSAERNMIS